MKGYCYYQHFEIPVGSPILRGNDNNLNVEIANVVSYGNTFSWWMTNFCFFQWPSTVLEKKSKASPVLARSIEIVKRNAVSVVEWEYQWDWSVRDGGQSIHCSLLVLRFVYISINVHCTRFLWLFMKIITKKKKSMLRWNSHQKFSFLLLIPLSFSTDCLKSYRAR